MNTLAFINFLLVKLFPTLIRQNFPPSKCYAVWYSKSYTSTVNPMLIYARILTSLNQFRYTNSVHTLLQGHALKYDLTDTFKNIFVLVSPSKDSCKHQV